MEQLELFVKHGLPSPKRRYVWNELTESSFAKEFKYSHEEEKLMAFAKDNVAMQSDCFILYAVLYLGLASYETVEEFLKVFMKGNWDLSFFKCSSEDDFHAKITNRAQVLFRNGFTFRLHYDRQLPCEGNLSSIDRISLLTATDFSLMLVKQRLKKTRFLMNNCIQYKPASELVAIASATYVMTKIMSASKDVEILDRVFRSGHVTCFLACEFCAFDNEGNAYYVAGVPGFWKRDKNVQTERDFAEWKAANTDLIVKYLTKRTVKGTAMVVISVEDEDDMRHITEFLLSVQAVRECADRILFTSEGVIREQKSGSLKGAFVRMVADTRGWSIQSYTPPFIEK